MEFKVWADVGLYHLPAEIQTTVQVLSLIYKMIKPPLNSSDSKESACNARDLGSVPGLGGSPREMNGSPLHYSCLENSRQRLQRVQHD